MPTVPKQLTSQFFPGMGEQHVVGLQNVGISVVTATLAVNTTRTDAQLIASPPNTDTAAMACGPVVHSLGTPPMAAWVLPYSLPVGLGFGITYQYVTADNSAVYFRAATWTGAAPVGQGVRVYAVR